MSGLQLTHKSQPVCEDPQGSGEGLLTFTLLQKMLPPTTCSCVEHGRDPGDPSCVYKNAQHTVGLQKCLFMDSRPVWCVGSGGIFKSP